MRLKSIVLAGVLGIALMSASGVAQAAPAATPTPVLTDAAPGTTNIVIIDPATGKTVKIMQSVPNSQVEAVRVSVLGKKLAGLAASQSRLTGRVTPNINRVYTNCTSANPNNLLVVYTDPTLLCFANQGYATNLAIWSVYEVYTGNNRAGVHYDNGNTTGVRPKNSIILFGGASVRVKITEVDIFAP